MEHFKAKKTKRPWQGELIGFVLVVVFCLFSVSVSQRGKSSKTSQGKTQELERLPASKVLNQTGDEKSTKIIHMGCLGASPSSPVVSTKTSASLVRFLAEKCADIDSISAKNESTGDDLILFSHPKEKKISSNYFPLRSGINRISLHWKNRGKETYRVFEIEKTGPGS